jgi:hypothetical protein
MAAGGQAGNMNTNSVLGCAYGVDCSGYVSRVWGRTNKLGTSNIPSYASRIDVLAPGDVYNQSGSHVVIHDAAASNGVYVYESTAYQNLDRVVRILRPSSSLSSYLRYRPTSACPSSLSSHTYWTTNLGATRNVTVRYYDTALAAPRSAYINYQYQSVSLRTGREPIAFASGTRAEGTYSWSRTLAGTQFKFYFEFIDSAGQAVRYPSSGWVE